MHTCLQCVKSTQLLTLTPQFMQENPPGAAEALRKERQTQGDDNERQFLLSGKFNASGVDASFKIGGKSSAKYGGDSAGVGLSSTFKTTAAGGAVPSVAREMSHTTQPPTLDDINHHLNGDDDDEG